jgi:DNA-binding transcriptional ArsR family regulator
MTSAAVAEDQLLEAVADSSRRMLLELLLTREATPTALAAEVPFTRQAVAKHLAVLGRVGLVTSTRQGREITYSVRPEHMDIAVRAMARVAARWDARLSAIKQIAESSEQPGSKRPIKLAPGRSKEKSAGRPKKPSPGHQGG